MTRLLPRLTITALVALVALPVHSEPPGPEATVKQYLTAIQASRFDDAYDLVSVSMKQGKDREVWVKEQKAGMSYADVKIFDFKVQPATVDGDTAQVPNILSSQDRFINQLGLTEYEVYTLVREVGIWKVDRQIIVEPPDIPKWFPGLQKDESPTDTPSH